MRGYYAKNKESEKARVAKWAKENPEKVAARQKRYYEKRKLNPQP